MLCYVRASKQEFNKASKQESWIDIAQAHICMARVSFTINVAKSIYAVQVEKQERVKNDTTNGESERKKGAKQVCMCFGQPHLVGCSETFGET